MGRKKLVENIEDTDTNELVSSLVKSLEYEFASTADESMIGDVTGYVDTGCYILNALLSGSIFGGLPKNKITTIAGPSTTGKTYFALSIIQKFLQADPKAIVMFFESEGAITKDMLRSRNIPLNRVIFSHPDTVEKFRHQAFKFLDKLGEAANPPNVMIVLDSIGALSTEKEINDISVGNDKVDLTKPKLIRGAMRVLSLKLSKMGIPMICTNHVYDSMDMFNPDPKMTGGAGLLYNSDYVVYLSKKKLKDETTKEVVGNIIHCKNQKSRLTIENKVVDVLLRYDTGLSKYYGLLELAEKHQIFKKKAKGYEMPDGSTAYEKNILAEPEVYYTEEILQQLDHAALMEFCYGQVDNLDNQEEI